MAGVFHYSESWDEKSRSHWLRVTDTDTLGGAVLSYKAARAAVETAEGYRNLCRLLSVKARKHTRFQDEEGLGAEDLARFARGFICLAG